MKERPIKAGRELVQAIFDRRVTQLKFVVEPQPDPDDWPNVIPCSFYHPTKVDGDGEEYPGNPVFGFANEDEGWECPYGAPGDVLWVREKWQRLSNGSGFPEYERAMRGLPDVFYQADESDPETRPISGRWRSAIQMPRWASRLNLEIMSIYVRRCTELDSKSFVWVIDFEPRDRRLPVRGGHRNALARSEP